MCDLQDRSRPWPFSCEVRALERLRILLLFFSTALSARLFSVFFRLELLQGSSAEVRFRRSAPCWCDLCRVIFRSVSAVMVFFASLVASLVGVRLDSGSVALCRFALRSFAVVAFAGRLSSESPLSPRFRFFSHCPAIVIDGVESVNF